jgi:hypothetical protein
MESERETRLDEADGAYRLVLRHSSWGDPDKQTEVYTAAWACESCETIIGIEGSSSQR